MTDAEKCKLVLMWDDGKATGEIAEVLCYHPTHVRYVAMQLGLPPRQHGGARRRRHKVTPEQVEQMRDARRSGATFRRIGELFGVSTQTAFNYVKYGRNQ